MNRSVALGLAHVVTSECVPLLKRLATYREDFPPPRFMVNSVRDKLYEACERFDDNTDLDEHQDVYFPMFDALGTINHALHFNPVLRVPLQRAAETLDGLLKHVTSFDRAGTPREVLFTHTEGNP